MRDWFDQDTQRVEQFSLKVNGIHLDYSRNRINKTTLALLSDLSNSLKIHEKIQGLFAGERVNTTEQRPALHTALRDLKQTPLTVNGENIADTILQTRLSLFEFVEAVHGKRFVGATLKPITTVINLGIGGSCLGPKMSVQALKDFAISDLNFHFISTVDESQISDVLSQIDPETTLFIVSSKSFCTLETLTNARTAANWLSEKLGREAVSRQFIAITAATDRASAFGIPPHHIFPIWDWVGGRYSLWSAIGLPLMLMIGRDHFTDFLTGAFEMDQHFKEADCLVNMPILLALLSHWYINFFNASAAAICPYSHRLRYLTDYLQQADMESNGKSVTLNGQPVASQTGSVIFGGEGCDGQHAYHQLLLQSQQIIPVDFIIATPSPLERPVFSRFAPDHHHQDILMASCLSQAQALMRGKTFEEARDALTAKHIPLNVAEPLARHQTIAGNKPSNLLFLKQLNPKNLGALLALYEHKIFTQSVLWNINPFDQWGVQLGKQLLPAILASLQGDDPSNNHALHHAMKHFFDAQEPSQ